MHYLLPESAPDILWIHWSQQFLTNSWVFVWYSIFVRIGYCWSTKPTNKNTDGYSKHKTHYSSHYRCNSCWIHPHNCHQFFLQMSCFQKTVKLSKLKACCFKVAQSICGHEINVSIINFRVWLVNRQNRWKSLAKQSNSLSWSRVVRIQQCVII